MYSERELFTFVGDLPQREKFVQELSQFFESRGYHFVPESVKEPKIVFYFLEPNGKNIKAYRRKIKNTIVVGTMVTEGRLLQESSKVYQLLYPLLIRSLSNVIIWISSNSFSYEAWLVTPEGGISQIQSSLFDEFFNAIYEHLRPIITSTLVIDNLFKSDLPADLWNGNERTKMLAEAGSQLNSLGLLPAPFPLEKILSSSDLRHLKRLFGIGGLSYGNLSIREPGFGFWISASGVDKSKLGKVGEDILLVTGISSKREIVISIPPYIQNPKRSSVEAITHYQIYTHFPNVNVIIHFHGWLKGEIPVTRYSYPCGTLEMGEEIHRIIAHTNPTEAEVGLRNHGVVLTGNSFEEIFERMEGRILRQVPMHELTIKA